MAKPSLMGMMVMIGFRLGVWICCSTVYSMLSVSTSMVLLKLSRYIDSKQAGSGVSGNVSTSAVDSNLTSI